MSRLPPSTSMFNHELDAILHFYQSINRIKHCAPCRPTLPLLPDQHPALLPRSPTLCAAEQSVHELCTATRLVTLMLTMDWTARESMGMAGCRKASEP